MSTSRSSPREGFARCTRLEKFFGMSVPGYTSWLNFFRVIAYGRYSRSGRIESA